MVAANDAPQPQRAPKLAVTGEAFRPDRIDIIATGFCLVSEHFSNPERSDRDR